MRLRTLLGIAILVTSSVRGQAAEPGLIFERVADYRSDWLRVSSTFRGRLLSAYTLSAHSGSDWDRWVQTFVHRLDHWHAFLFWRLYQFAAEPPMAFPLDRQEMRQFYDDFCREKIEPEFAFSVEAFLSPLGGQPPLHDEALARLLRQALSQAMLEAVSIREQFVSDLIDLWFAVPLD